MQNFFTNFDAVKKENSTLESRLLAADTRRNAFAELISTFSEPLYWQIRRLVKSHDDTDDLLQNTFMKAWLNLDGFRGDAKLSTWLNKIALNEALTFLDQQKRHATESIDDEDSQVSNQLEADEWIDGDEAAAALRHAVESLPTKQQLVFNMKYFDEMKYEEIAEITGTSVGALKASYHLAVKKIEQILQSVN